MMSKVTALVLGILVLVLAWLLFIQFKAPPRLSVLRRDQGPFWMLTPPTDTERRQLGGADGSQAPATSAPAAPRTSASPSLIEPPGDLARRAAIARAAILRPQPIIATIVGRLEEEALRGLTMPPEPAPAPTPAKPTRQAPRKSQPAPAAPAAKTGENRVVSLSVTPTLDGAVIRCATAQSPERLELMTLSQPPKATIDLPGPFAAFPGPVAVPDNPAIASIEILRENGKLKIVAHLKNEKVRVVPTTQNVPASGFAISFSLDPSAAPRFPQGIPPSEFGKH